MAFDDLDRLTREQLAHLAKPVDDRRRGGIKRPGSRFLRVIAVRAATAAGVLAAVEVVKRLLAAAAAAARFGQALVGVPAEHQPPAIRRHHRPAPYPPAPYPPAPYPPAPCPSAPIQALR